MKRDIYYDKLGIRVASRVAERLKTKDLMKYQANLKFGWRQPSAQSSFQKLNFGNSSEKTRKSKYQTFLVLSSFTGFLYFVSNILSRIVDTLSSKNFTDKAPNHGKGSSVPLQYAVAVYTGMPQKTLGTTLQRCFFIEAKTLFGDKFDSVYSLQIKTCFFLHKKRLFSNQPQRQLTF